MPHAAAGDWPQIFALLDSALELEAVAHAGWLETLPPGQAHLARLLKELLRVHAGDSGAGFMQTSASFAIAGPDFAGAAPAADGTATPETVGPYRFLHEIGQGGMAPTRSRTAARHPAARPAAARHRSRPA